MAEDYTPTTAQVRDAYVRAMRNAFVASSGEHAAEFDRWLAEHDAEKDARTQELEAVIQEAYTAAMMQNGKAAATVLASADIPGRGWPRRGPFIGARARCLYAHDVAEVRQIRSNVTAPGMVEVRVSFPPDVHDEDEWDSGDWRKWKHTTWQPADQFTFDEFPQGRAGHA